MPFANDLLEQAKHLANRERKRPRQASLRRAVSTAYYALFHLLIQEATHNWRRAEHRPLLARFFEHGKMKAASERQRGDCTRYLNAKPPPPSGQLLNCMKHLLSIADAFVQAQQQRHTADYDNSAYWTKTEVLALIAIVEGAFQSWATIRNESMAQDYLFSLLGTPKG